MYSIKWSNIFGRSGGFNSNSKQKIDDFIQEHLSKGTFGKPARQTTREQDSFDESLVISEFEDTDKDGNTITIVSLKAEYEYTIENLSLDINFRNQQKTEARKKEYRSVEEIMHIILDHGLDSQEFADLQAERQAIKTKYSKE